jgi:hypothetical protein
LSKQANRATLSVIFEQVNSVCWSTGITVVFIKVFVEAFVEAFVEVFACVVAVTVSVASIASDKEVR